jgi:hypothetical protein
MARALLNDFPNWEDRLAALGAATQTFAGYYEPSLDRAALVRLGSGEIARQVMEHFGAPAIESLHQALFYAASSDQKHVLTFEMWQAAHQDEMRPFVVDNPMLDALATDDQVDRARCLAICAEAGVDPGEITEIDGELMISDQGVRNLAAAHPDKGELKYILAQMTQIRRRSIRTVLPAEDVQ